MADTLIHDIRNPPLRNSCGAIARLSRGTGVRAGGVVDGGVRPACRCFPYKPAEYARAGKWFATGGLCPIGQYRNEAQCANDQACGTGRYIMYLT